MSEGNELRRHAVRGAAATVSAQWLGLLLHIAGTIVLARLLTPADFGIVALATTFSLLLMSVGSNGLHEAIIQRDVINRYQASNLFWISSGVGLILTIAFAAAGSLLAQLYEKPLVAQVAVEMSVAIFVTAVSEIHVALLKRGMRFLAVSANVVVARAVYTAVAVLLAHAGWGYRALVLGIVAHAFSTTIGAWWLCRWLPSLPVRGVGTRGMLTFASKVFGRFTANYSSRNVDTLLIGWQFDAAAVGLYKRAYDLFALWESQLTSPLHSIALAALSRMNHDHARLRRYLANSVGIVAFVGMAVGADLTLIGRDVVRLAFGLKWTESGSIFALFGPGIGVMLLYNTVGWIHLSTGNPGRWLRWTVIETAVTFLFFVLALPWGPAGIALAWSASFWILLIPAFWYAGVPIGFGISSFVASVWRYVAASLLAGMTTVVIMRGTLFVTPTTAEAAFVSASATSAWFLSLYVGAVTLLHGGYAPLRQLAVLFRDLTVTRAVERPGVEVVR